MGTEQRIEEAIIANNHEHNLPQTKECTCGDDMKLELKEDTQGGVRYFYVCTYKKCDIIEEVNEES